MTALRARFRIPYTVPTVGAVLGVSPPFKLPATKQSSDLQRPKGARFQITFTSSFKRSCIFPTFMV